MSLLKEIKSDRTEKIMELLQSPQDLNVKDNKTGNSLVHFVIENQNLQILTALLSLDKKPNLNVFNNENVSPLSYATMLNFADGLEPLLKHGADPNLTHQGGRTPLHYAAVNNSKELVRLLLKFHSNINQTNEEGSALHIATRESNDDVAFYLMENPNIDFFTVDAEGNTFLHVAIQYGAYNIFQKFFSDLENGLHSGVNVSELLNKTNKSGNTLLHEAEIMKRTSISGFLRQNAEKFKLETTKKNKEGFTPDECKAEHAKKAQEEEELKKLRKEEAKEIRKQRKEEMDKLNEERRVQEIQYKKKEKEREQQAAKDYNNQQAKKPFIAIALVMAVIVTLYVALNYGIQKKKNNVMDL